MLLESILEQLPTSKGRSCSDGDDEDVGGALGTEALKILELFPNYGDHDHSLQESPFERAIGRFFSTFQNASSSTIGALAADCAVSLSVRYINHHFVRSVTAPSETPTPTNAPAERPFPFSDRFRSSPLVRGILSAKRRFALESRRLMGDGDDLGDGDGSSSGVRAMAPTLLEVQIRSVYEPVRRGRTTVPVYDLQRDGAVARRLDPTVLSVLSRRDIEKNEICDARFALGMAVRLGAFAGALEEAHDRLVAFLLGGTSSRWWDMEEDGEGGGFGGRGRSVRAEDDTGRDGGYRGDGGSDGAPRGGDGP